MAHAAAFELPVHDHGRVGQLDGGNIQGSSGFDIKMHRGQAPHEFQAFGRVQQGFASGDADKLCPAFEDGVFDLCKTHFPAASKSVNRVAPSAAQVAAGKPHEVGELSGMQAFALKR